MSIFKRLGGKDSDPAKVEIEDETSDDLPAGDYYDGEHNVSAVTRAIRSNLENEDDDIEDLAESSMQSVQRASMPKDAPLELSVEEILSDGGSHTEINDKVEPYVDARGIEPVAREDIDDSDIPLISPLLEDIYEAPLLPHEDEQGPDIEDLSDQLELSTAMDTQPAAPRGPGMNLGELRLDIVRITSDIESGEALYRRAQQRVDSLVGFIEKAEVAVSRLSKMEPENRRLLSENRELETDVEAQRYKLAQLESDLESQRRLATDAHVKTETLRATLTGLNDEIAERHREIETLVAENDELKIQKERTKTNLDIETRENITMREKLTELSNRSEALTDDKVELQKAVDMTSFDLRDMKDRINTLEIENSELLLNFRNSERQNTLMKDELTEIQDKIVSFKTQHETHLRRRDDKIAALAARNAELEQTLKHKENIIESTIEDVSQLRKTNTRHDIEREKLEQMISSQSFQLHKAEEELLSSKHKMTELDQRYKDVAEALAMKRIRQSPSRHAVPDIQPKTPQNRSTDRVSQKT